MLMVGAFTRPKVYPSGLVRMSSAHMTQPLPPGLLMTVTGCPRILLKGWATRRHIMSELPPAENPTSSVMGWVG